MRASHYTPPPLYTFKWKSPLRDCSITMFCMYNFKNKIRILKEIREMWKSKCKNLTLVMSRPSDWHLKHSVATCSSWWYELRLARYDDKINEIQTPWPCITMFCMYNFKNKIRILKEIREMWKSKCKNLTLVMSRPSDWHLKHSVATCSS